MYIASLDLIVNNATPRTWYDNYCKRKKTCTCTLGRGDLWQKIQIISSISMITSVTKWSWLLKSKNYYGGCHPPIKDALLPEFLVESKKARFFLSTTLNNCLVLAFLVSSSVTRRIWPVFLEIWKGVIGTLHYCSLLPEFCFGGKNMDFFIINNIHQHFCSDYLSIFFIYHEELAS